MENEKLRHFEVWPVSKSFGVSATPDVRKRNDFGEIYTDNVVNMRIDMKSMWLALDFGFTPLFLVA